MKLLFVQDRLLVGSSLGAMYSQLSVLIFLLYPFQSICPRSSNPGRDTETLKAARNLGLTRQRQKNLLQQFILWFEGKNDLQLVAATETTPVLVVQELASVGRHLFTVGASKYSLMETINSVRAQLPW